MTTGVGSRLQRFLGVEPGELTPLVTAFCYFFCLLCSYYILRPLRDEMGLQGGVQNLQWVFTGTFVAMLLAVPLFGWAAARYPRRRLVPLVYYFFMSHLIAFYLLFLGHVTPAWTARAFFIWVSVFNLFVVSVFWSLMADVFTNEQARRLFGIIAAGGSAGAVAGPALTVTLARVIGPTALVGLSILLLLIAIGCVHVLIRWRHRNPRVDEAVEQAETALSGGVLDGALRVLHSRYLLGICLFIVLYTTLSTFLYFQQAHIVQTAFAGAGRQTAVFAGMDLAVNVITLAGQIFLVSRLIRRMGVPVALAAVPLLLTAGFAALAAFPVLTVLIVVQVLRRSGEYAVTKPSREILFTVIPREDKYKSKNFIDTVVYRGGDMMSGWVYAGLSSLGLGLGSIALIAVPLSAFWAFTGISLGRRQETLCKQ